MRSLRGLLSPSSCRNQLTNGFELVKIRSTNSSPLGIHRGSTRRSVQVFYDQQTPKAWGRVLHDEDLAPAIIDRVLERGRLLRLDGPSVRTLHVNLDEAMKEDSDQEADLVRISGTEGTAGSAA